MGRTLPTATVAIMQEEQAFSRFRRALRRTDQLALDDLFVSARQHLAAAQYAAHALPFEVFLLSMLLEEHKEVMKLRERVETFLAKLVENQADTGRSATVWRDGAPLQPAGAGSPHGMPSGCIDPGFGFDDDPGIDPENKDG